MFRIFKSELYIAIHSPFFCALFALIVVISIPITACGTNLRDVHNVIVFDVSMNDRYTNAIQAIIDQNYYARYDSKTGKYMIASEAESLLKPGNTLYDEYGWLLDEKYERKQFIEDTYYSADEKNVFETWRFNRILKDNAAIVLLGIIFAVFFFGQDFTRRGYSAYILAGQRRFPVLAGKFCAYIAVSSLLSIVVLIVAVISFVPSVFVLGADYVLRCIGTRFIIDMGFLCIPIIFPFIFHDIIKSMCVGVLFVILFFSNRAVIDLHFMTFS